MPVGEKKIRRTRRALLAVVGFEVVENAEAILGDAQLLARFGQRLGERVAAGVGVEPGVVFVARSLTLEVSQRAAGETGAQVARIGRLLILGAIVLARDPVGRAKKSLAHALRIRHEDLD